MYKWCSYSPGGAVENNDANAAGSCTCDVVVGDGVVLGAGWVVPFCGQREKMFCHSQSKINDELLHYWCFSLPRHVE